jgi:hypothetical protein
VKENADSPNGAGSFGAKPRNSVARLGLLVGVQAAFLVAIPLQGSQSRFAPKNAAVHYLNLHLFSTSLEECSQKNADSRLGRRRDFTTTVSIDPIQE